MHTVKHNNHPARTCSFPPTLAGCATQECESEVADYPKYPFRSTNLLTYMATFSILLDERRLIRITVPLARGQFHERKIYALPDCFRWIVEDVPKMKTGRANSASTPHEQIVERFRQWMSGDPIANGPMFHDMRPVEDAAWELKTDDLRVFGWMYKPREFIAVCGGYADDYKPPTKTKNYADDRRTVVKARDELPLDGTKHVEGDFDDLV
jgi:hypothetical protein